MLILFCFGFRRSNSVNLLCLPIWSTQHDCSQPRQDFSAFIAQQLQVLIDLYLNCCVARVCCKLARHWMTTLTFVGAGHHRSLTGTKLYCLVTEAHVCEKTCPRLLPVSARPRVEPATFVVASPACPNHYATVEMSS